MTFRRSEEGESSVDGRTPARSFITDTVYIFFQIPYISLDFEVFELTHGEQPKVTSHVNQSHTKKGAGVDNVSESISLSIIYTLVTKFFRQNSFFNVEYILSAWKL